MNRAPPLTLEVLADLLAQVIENQRAEGYVITTDEIAEVCRRMRVEHLQHCAWSPSWSCLATIARILRRPDLLRCGRLMELFAQGIALTCVTSTESAWEEIERTHAAGRRGLLLAALELLHHGPPALEKTDPARFRLLARGISAARCAGLPERILALWSPGDH
jgi:hypothetical protein